MIIKISVEAFSINEPTEYNILEEGELKGYPALTIDRDSYMTDTTILASFQQCDGFIPYNFEIGKCSSIAPNVTVIIDNNHDYLAPCQGCPRNFALKTKGHIRREGEILIENDCWIGMGQHSCPELRFTMEL